MIAIAPPPLTDEERAALDSIDLDGIWEKVEASLPPEERRPWRVTDRWGNTIVRHRTKAEAWADAIKRNRRAKARGIEMRYRVTKQ
jgi:hypothetical protein